MREGSIPCEICEVNPVTTCKGGVYNNTHTVWMICDKCIEKVDDRRREVRNDGTDIP